MLKYNVLDSKLDQVERFKNKVIEDVQGYFDSEMLPLYEELIDDDVEAPTTYEDACDIYHEYIDDGVATGTTDLIEETESEISELKELEEKIDEIQDIIDEIANDFNILNIEVSKGSVSTYLTIQNSDEFDKKYNNHEDFGYVSDDSKDITVRISDHEVGGNQFVNYSHSEYEWII